MNNIFYRQDKYPGFQYLLFYTFRAGEAVDEDVRALASVDDMLRTGWVFFFFFVFDFQQSHGSLFVRFSYRV